MSDAVSIAERFPQAKHREFRGQRWMEILSHDVSDVLAQLKQVGFNFLVDITCVDYLQYRADGDHQPSERFGLTYLLANATAAQRITVRAYLDDQDRPTVNSVVALWEGANWLEREVYDMFGIHFDGHPNLRRILLPDEFAAHPLRKDYPLQGRGERHNFPVIARSDA